MNRLWGWIKSFFLWATSPIRRNGPKPEKGSPAALIRSVRWLTVGLILGLPTLLAIGIAIYVVDQDNDQQTLEAEEREEEEEARQQAENLLIRQKETCANDNRETTTRRQLEAERPIVYGQIFFRLSHEEAVAAVAERGGQAFLDEVVRLLPYRICTIECVIAHTRPDIDNCPPAVDEEGNPPPGFIPPSIEED